MTCFVDNATAWSPGRQVIGVTSAFPLLKEEALDWLGLELVNPGSFGAAVS